MHSLCITRAVVEKDEIYDEGVRRVEKPNFWPQIELNG